jgi:hypothetical protein
MDQAEGMQHQNIAPVVPPEVAQEAQEKVLKQSEVNELVGRIKHEAYQKGLREGSSQQPAQPMQPGQSTQIGGGLGGMPSITEDQVRQLIADESQKQAQMAAAHNTLNSFVQQMGAGKGKYSDFDETVAKLGDLKHYPHIVQLAAGEGNAGDIMYELGRNPGKVASLTTLAYINPDLAKLEMKKLADSIRTNEQQSKSPSVDEPLSQVKPSTVGADNGSNTVRDLRRKSWARA